MTPHVLQNEIDSRLMRYFEDLGTVMRENGMLEEYGDLISFIGLTPEDLRGGTGRLSFENYFAALEWVNGIGRLPGLGLRLGARKHHGAFGLRGLALLAQRTLGEALRFSADTFEFCWGSSLQMDLEQEEDWMVVRYLASTSQLARCAPLMEQVVATSFALVSEAVPNLEWSRCRAMFGYEIPWHVDLYGKYIPSPCLFGQTYHGWRMPVSWLDLPYGIADEDARSAFKSRFNKLINADSGPSALQRQIRQLLLDSIPDCPMGIREIARHMGLSEQALRVRLSREGASFRAILNEVVIERAIHLLGSPNYSIKEIAFHLGYSQPPSFYRAFVKATGKTPKQFQKDLGHTATLALSSHQKC